MDNTATAIATRSGLTADQMAQFDREGYLVVEDVFDDADLQPVIDEISLEVEQRASNAVAAGTLSHAYEELDFEHRLAAISRESDQVARSIWSGQLAGPAFFDLIRNPKLLDVAEQMVGREIIASSVYRLRPKLPH